MRARETFDERSISPYSETYPYPHKVFGGWKTEVLKNHAPTQINPQINKERRNKTWKYRLSQLRAYASASMFVCGGDERVLFVVFKYVNMVSEYAMYMFVCVSVCVYDMVICFARILTEIKHAPHSHIQRKL